MSKTVNDYIELPYTIETIKDDGCFFIKIKELPGCFSQGDTIEEAYEMIEEAKRFWIEAALDDKITIPMPESMQPEASYSGKITLRMPKSLHMRLSLAAVEDNCSLNSYITTLLSEQNSFKSIDQKLNKLVNNGLSFFSNLDFNKKEWNNTNDFLITTSAEEHYQTVAN